MVKSGPVAWPPDCNPGRILMHNLFDSSDTPPHGERFDSLLVHRNLVIERIVSSADIQPVDYLQPQDEWVILVRGAAIMDVDGKRTTLGPGDYLFLPAGTPHRLETAEPGTLWLAVHLFPGGGQ